VLIALNTTEASMANASMVRETVGSEACRGAEAAEAAICLVQRASAVDHRKIRVLTVRGRLGVLHPRPSDSQVSTKPSR
jgi:hypothetical protein